jgi:7-dehydrocholesterol reductase
MLVLMLVRWGAPATSPDLVYSGHGGDLGSLVNALRTDPVEEFMSVLLPVECEGARTWACNEAYFARAATHLFAFMAFQIVTLLILPGSIHYGPTSASGHTPEYVTNGVASYVIALFGFELLASNGIIEGDVIMQLYPFFIVILNVFALVLCTFLTFKGIFAPSTPDASSSGDPIMDFYWGTELYPNILGVDVKTFTNCRFGMVAWALCLVSFAHFSVKLNDGVLHYDMAAATFLTVFYLGKFFIWEHGYFNTMDIAHDRAGFYICWGCLVWVQTVYVTYGYHYASKTVDSVAVMFGEDNAFAGFLVIIAVGMAMVFLNYIADRQRMHARQTQGRGSAWGAKYECIHATYETEDGRKHKSILLASHLWLPARHFHYVFEIAAAVAWSVPLSLTTVFPNFYWIFLTCLLVDRAVRDDARCAAKYGKHWDQYRERVPFLILPGIF